MSDRKLSAALRSAMLCGECVSETLIAEAAQLEAEVASLRVDAERWRKTERSRHYKIGTCAYCAADVLADTGEVYTGHWHEPDAVWCSEIHKLLSQPGGRERLQQQHDSLADALLGAGQAAAEVPE